MANLSAQASTEIEATADALWAILQDVEAWPQWQGTLGEVTVQERGAEDRVALCEVVFDAKIQTIRSVLRFAYDPPTRLTFTQDSGSLQAISGAWQLDDLGDGRTRATYELEVEPGGMLGLLLSGSVIEKMRGLLVDPQPDELKARAEAT